MKLSDLEKETLSQKLIQVIEAHDFDNPDLDEAKRYIAELEEALDDIERIANNVQRLF